MGLGLILWGSSSLLCGWASGTFGLFGLKRQPVSNPMLNYIGVALSIVGLMLYMQVKTNDTNVDSNTITESENRRNQYSNSEVMFRNTRLFLHPRRPHSYGELASHDTEVIGENAIVASVDYVHQEETPVGLNVGDNWSEESRRIAGILLAILNGCLVGFSFDPAQYVIDNEYDGHDNSLNYVFSQFLGIFFTSWGYTILYMFYCKTHEIVPYVNHEIVLPATASGAIWSVAMIAWFIANGQLGFPITFPIISAGPGFVGAMWGIFVFGEITGTRNLSMLLLAAGVTVPALIIVAVSH